MTRRALETPGLGTLVVRGYCFWECRQPAALLATS